MPTPSPALRPETLQTWPDFPASTTTRPEPTVLLAQANGVALPLPGHSVHTVVFSPPYWALRRYAGDTQVFTWPGMSYQMPGGEITLPGDPACEHEWVAEVSPPGRGSIGHKSTLGGGQNHQVAARLLTPTPDNCNDVLSLPKGGLGASSLSVTENLRDTAQGGQPQTTDVCLKCGAVRCALGLEPDPDMFIGHLLLILREVRRVLRKDGTLWLNLGFSYAASRSGGAYKTKDLVAIPWLLAIAAQYDGWYLRSPIVWSKGNAMPSSVTDRPSQDWEQILLLSPSERYYYDREALREPLDPASVARNRYAWPMYMTKKLRRFENHPF